MTGRGLEHYLRSMGRLRVDRNRNRYTSGMAPHKPTLLLSLIVLHNNGRQDLSDIRVDLDLRETWSELWKCLDYERPGPIHLPLYHMKSDGFWNVDLENGISPHQPKSISHLENMTSRISMDRDLIELIEDQRSRDRIISSLLNGGYYSDEERKRLIERMEVLNGSFRYESEMMEKVKEEFTPEVKVESGVLLPSRDPAFRRMILGAYSETCAVCGMRLQTTSGISVIDAAHILPFNRFHNDDIRNGMALCKMHHWLFDRGILSVDDHFRVLVSGSIEREHPDNIISRFHKLDLRLPDDKGHSPHPLAVEWHRENVFER